MMRLLYTLLFYLLMPVITLRLLWRSIDAPLYRQRWAERWGFFPPTRDTRSALWIHTVSVGETLAAKPLIAALLTHYPDHQIIITTTTPTGSTQVQQGYRDMIAANRVVHGYIPYDVPDAIYRFLRRTRPQLAIFMETEVWPTILAICEKKAIPAVLVNARLSVRSLRRYQWWAALSCPAFSRFTVIAAQSRDDRDRIKQLATDVTITVTGNMKSEIILSDHLKKQAQQLRRDWSQEGQKTVMIAVSTHEGEEDIILAAYQQLSQHHPQLTLVLVPRHPERFARVKRQCIRQGLTVLSRSEQVEATRETQVIIGDTLGEIILMCGTADIAIVGGSFIDHGGHNMLEPAAWGIPVLSGPSVFNFASIAQAMAQQQGLLMVDNQQQLVQQLDCLLKQPRYAKVCGEQARHYVNASKGALSKTLQVIQQTLA